MLPTRETAVPDYLFISKLVCSWYTPTNFLSTTSTQHHPFVNNVRGCLEGLAHIHSHSIKHRDLNPRNILLFEKPIVRVTPITIDFGVSKEYVQDAKSGS